MPPIFKSLYIYIDYAYINVPKFTKAIKYPIFSIYSLKLINIKKMISFIIKINVINHNFTLYISICHIVSKNLITNKTKDNKKLENKKKRVT